MKVKNYVDSHSSPLFRFSSYPSLQDLQFTVRSVFAPRSLSCRACQGPQGLYSPPSETVEAETRVLSGKGFPRYFLGRRAGFATQIIQQGLSSIIAQRINLEISAAQNKQAVLLLGKN
ncbi:UNVERIFIED_CONTAM: hypothetical protein K2H54_038559 [Gekko kuhli]